MLFDGRWFARNSSVNMYLFLYTEKLLFLCVCRRKKILFSIMSDNFFEILREFSFQWCLKNLIGKKSQYWSIQTKKYLKVYIKLLFNINFSIKNLANSLKPEQPLKDCIPSKQLTAVTPQLKVQSSKVFARLSNFPSKFPHIPDSTFPFYVVYSKQFYLLYA